MYLNYWRLHQKPFENTPDPRFLYPSLQHREGLQKLLYAIGGDKGCALLTGEYGCGKTILVRTIVQNLDEEYFDVGLINYPIFDRDNFLREIAAQFGEDCDDCSRVQLFRHLSRFFYDNVERNRRNVVVIDEAQLIDDPQVFEELRLLLNIQLEDRFLLNILLVGQPELRERIMGYPQLDQRIAVKFHLHRFDHKETVHYIRHRLEIAGCQQSVFTPEALYLIFKVSNGIPRRINNLADLCLLQGANSRVERINEEIIKRVL